MARQIVVDIVGDSRKFNAATQAAVGNTGHFGVKTAAVFGAVSGVVGSFTTKAIDAIGGFATDLIGMGPTMEAMDAKAKTVFGGSLGLVKTWAEANAAAMGLTRREATGLAANMGDLLIPMGFTRDAAAAMSTDIVGLSGALSEWSGGTRTSAEVSEILQKALLGERDGLKELGISISEADVQQQLLKDGTDGLKGAQLAQAKAQATQTLLMAKSTDAQKAYADGTAKGIRTQHEMEAQLKEVKETLAKALYPVLQAVTGFIAKNLPAAIKTAGDVFNWLSKNVMPAVAAVFKVLVPVIGFFIGNMVKSFETWIKIIGVVVDVIRSIVGVVSTVAGKVGDIFRGLSGAIGKAFGAIGGVVRGVFNGVIDAINSVIRAINGIQVHIHVGPVNYDFNGLGLGYIPRLHAGGIVPGVAGTDVLTMLQAGERVTPRNQSGSGTTVIHIHIDRGAYIDGPGIDILTNRIAQRLRYSSGT